MTQARTRWIFRHPLQMKYLLIVIVAILAPTLVTGFCFYKLVFNLLAQQLAFPEAVAENLIPVIEQVNSLLLIFIPLIFLVIAWLSIAISHQFVGPLERIEKDLDKILAGDYQHRIYLRQQDDLKDIASKINALVDRLRP
jgi:methyl-accepting chemotaxis protein